MILIADSGSTKTHWCIAENGNMILECYTGGINPYYQSEDDIKTLIQNDLLPRINNALPQAIYFYGAGCGSQEKQDIVRRTLNQFFPDSVIEVASDMLGACRALFGNKQGIACILGTGSNSCWYDGEKMVKNVPALGFILGDEGSGAVLGKRLVADCLKNQLPEDLKNKFMERFGLTPDNILDKVYKQAFPNRFLAGLSVFLKENIDNPLIRTLVYDEFNLFFQRNIMQYPYTTLQVGFIGSIAHHYSELLSRAAAANRVCIHQITQDPVNGLINYHSGE